MKQVLSDISKQPESVKVLISHLILSAMQDRRIVSRIELDSKQQQWLRDEGFQFSFNEDIQEWEVLIKEKE